MSRDTREDQGQYFPGGSVTPVAPTHPTPSWPQITDKPADLVVNAAVAGNTLTLSKQGGATVEFQAGGSDVNAVHYIADTGKSAAEKAQARTNIDAEAAGAAATAKGEAIAAAASDATQKANAAEQAAKNYTNSKLAWHTVELSDPEDGWEQPFTRVTVTRNTTYDLSTLNGFTEDESLYGEFALQFDVSGLAIGDEFSLVSNGDGLLLVNGIEFIGHDEDWVRLGVAYSYNDAMVGAYLQQMMSGGCEMMMTFKVVNIEDTGVTRLSVYGGNNNYVVES